jgi:DNA topoisomerase-2
MTKTKIKIEEQYKKLSHREHILTRPDTYIGNIKTETKDIFTVNDINNLNDIKIIKKTIEYNAGFVKIFDEILVNASDHSIRTGKVKSIKVEINGDEISVWNDGDGIPVVIHKDEKVYVPELIFGHLLTGENYNDTDERIVGGRNGLGGKLCNIFSTKFLVETADGKNYFKQIFTDNLSTDKKGKLPKPKIKSSSKNFTKITFLPDYERFGLSNLTDDLKSVLIKRVIDIAAYNPNIKVYYNGTLIPIKSFKDYIKLYLNDNHEIFYEKLNDKFEIAVVKSDFERFEQVSMVNGIATIEGGSHVNTIINNITGKLKTILTKGNKYNINPNDIKSKIFLFVNSKIVNPEFTAQTKEVLSSRATGFSKDCEVSDNFIKKISKSDITQEILDYIDLKEQLALKKAVKNGNNSRVRIAKLDDANKAGTHESHKCSLFLTEGDSALSTCLRGFSVVGRDYYGAFPLRGKPLNVRGTALKKIHENVEIKNIISALGLEFGKKYTDISSLRYGKLVIMSDQDNDGSHIKGLVINLFDTFWPELLQLDFIYEFITPILRASKGNIVKYFYKLNDYKKWKEQVDINNYFCKYYKGLGTIEPPETKMIFKDISKHLIRFNYREPQLTEDLIDMVFNDKRAEDRKNWLLKYNPTNEIDKFSTKTYYDSFINDELIEFSMGDNIRSIPNVIDGFKPSQRKILYALTKFNYKNEEKVSNVSGAITSLTSYHHGPASMEQAIIGMAQDFIGSNNINLLTPSGEFGTRAFGGKDASSSRYIFTKLQPITKFIFNDDDNPILEYNTDDGKQIEPKVYIPIIPMILVNGTEGIGTGWSTTVPQYNIEDIIEYIEKKMNGVQSRKNIEPYYKGFKGKIVLDGNKYVTYGKFERSDVDKITITELPIGMWYDKYYNILDKLIENKIIIDYIKHSTDKDVKIIIKLSRITLSSMTDDDIINTFSLTTNINNSNMKLFDMNGIIISYDDIYQIIDYFYDIRINYYDKRKQYLLNKIRREIDILENRIKFLGLVVLNKIVVSNRSKDMIIKNIEEYKLIKIDDSYDYLLNMSIYSLTKEKIEEFKNKLVEKQQEYKDIEVKTNKEMWKEDLSVLKREYKKLYLNN